MENKIETRELATIADPNKIFEQNLNKKDNIFVDNTDKLTFEIVLEDGAIVESLVTLTIYNWQSYNSKKCLAYLPASHI